MNVVFKNMIKAYSGKCDGLVYYYNRKFHTLVARKLPHRKITAENIRFREIAANLRALELSEGYKSDLKFYCIYYTNRREYRDKPVSNWYNLFMRLMWQMSKDLNIDLLTLTREQIERDNLPCRSVNQAVNAQLIPTVINFETLTNQM